MANSRLLGMALLSVAAWSCGGSQARATDAGDSSVPDADTVAPEDLATILEPIRAQYGVPALGALVLDGSLPVALGVVGLRKTGEETQATNQDKFHLGSCTKTMTATLMAVLEQEDIVTWDLKLVDALPTLAANMHETYKSVTLEQLLGHRGGTPGSIAAAQPETWAALWTATEGITDQRLWFAEQILSAAPEVTPDTSRYSNAGYMVAGAVIEQITGESWEALLTEHIFSPLGMSSCGFGPPASAGLTDQPWGHNGDQPVAPGPAADNPPALGPAGTVHCSLQDWGKFIAVHIAGARGESEFLSAANFSKLQTPSPDSSYGLGWLIVDRPWAGGTALNHAGSNTMFFANVWAAPAKNRAFLVVANRGDQPSIDAVDSVFGDLIEQYP